MVNAPCPPQDTAPLNTAAPRQGGGVRGARRTGKTVSLIAAACVLLALCLLLIPLLVGGAEPPKNPSPQRGEASLNARTQYTTWQQAAAALNLSPAFPAEWPDGFQCTGYYVRDGRLLELEFTAGLQRVVLRVCAGNEDLSGADYDTLAYTATEETENHIVAYAGVSEKKLSCAVWVQAPCAYALVSESGLDASLMKALAQSFGG